MEESLLESAMIRAAECSLLFSHTRPDSTLCMTVNDKMSGENIAMGQSTASSVMTSWMNSDGHRENILTEEYGSIGIGCFQIDGRYYWTQCFAEEKISTNCGKPVTTKAVTLSANLPKETFQEASATSGIIFGVPNEYIYQYELSFANKSFIERAKTTAKVTLINPGDYENTTVNIKNMTFSTSDSKIAEVNQNGTVIARKKGIAPITVQGKYFKATAEIKVTSGTENEKKNKKVKSISLSAPSKKIAAGKRVEVIADISPGNASNKQLNWTTSNPKYATVSEKGVVTTKKAGKGKTVTITAKATDGSGTKATIKLKLMKNAVTKVKIANSKKTVQTGRTLKLKARVKTDGKNANKSLKWKSSNNAYATVDKNGVVKTKETGKGKTVTITAMSTDGTNKKAKIKIKIK